MLGNYLVDLNAAEINYTVYKFSKNANPLYKKIFADFAEVSPPLDINIQ